MTLSRLLKSLYQRAQGTAAIEFALLLPVLMIFFIGVTEVTRLILVYNKVDKVVYAMADFATQSTRDCVQFGELNAFRSAADSIMMPFDSNGTNMSIVFTSITNVINPRGDCTGVDEPCVLWQFPIVGNEDSRIAPGGVGSSNLFIPNGAEVTEGKSVIVAEVYYRYTPLFAGAERFVEAVAPTQIYRASIFAPRRNGSLNQLGDCR